MSRESHKILMATDYSGPSFDAACYAAKYAVDTNSSLMFLHVYPPITSAEMAFYEPSWQKDRVEYEIWKLHDFVHRVCEAAKVDQEKLAPGFKIADGPIGGKILEISQQEKTNLLILGTHGTKGIGEVFMGSHGWSVIKKSTIPVLAVPPGFKYEKIQHIAFALEGSEHELLSIDQFNKTFANSGTRFSLFHITDIAGEVIYEKQNFLNFCQQVKEHLGRNDVRTEFRYSHKLVDGLNDFCKEHHVHWLVMAPERLNAIERFLVAFSSISKSMVSHTKFPLLIQHPVSKI